MTDFTTQLLQWYKLHKRPLPWRETTDPYKIWISEIILQQTQVVQGTGYYFKFLKHYPNVKALANAEEDEVLRLWQGLGYYSRARNLHKAAKTIVKDFETTFPDNYTDLLSLNGIGPYTAAAIASFAYNLPYAVIDGNVYRFLSRLKGIDTPIDSNEGKKQFDDLANALLNKKDPANHNQAMMEMGATVCKPKNPDCLKCPFHVDCAAYQTGQVDNLPVKSKKTKQRHRYFHYFWVYSGENKVMIHKRDGKDIWQNLYQLPLYESSKKLTAKHFEKKVSGSFKLLKETKHILSHQIIHAGFFLTDKESLQKLGLSQYEEINVSKCVNYAFPQLVVNFLNEQNLPGYVHD